MRLRDLILENKWWKLLSLLIAVMLWLYIDGITNDEPLIDRARGGREATARFPKPFPVRELVASGDPHIYSLEPAEVEVTLIGDASIIRKVRVADILVVADLTTLPVGAASNATREFKVPVNARVSQPVTATVNPATVRVRQSAPPAPVPISNP